jgi:hypothetical protein
VRFHEPACDREPETRAGGPHIATQASEGCEDVARVAGRDAGPAVRDLDPYRIAVDGCAHVDVRPWRRVLRGVLDEVAQDLIDLDVVEQDGGQVLRDIHADAVRGGDRSEAAGHLLAERTDVVPPFAGREHAGLDPREVEQVADQPIQTARLSVDRVRELGALLVRPVDVALTQASRCRKDRRERGAQVVRHGVEESGLQLVGPAQDLRVEGLSPQPLDLDALCEKGTRRREETIVGRAERAAGTPPHEERPDARVSRDERHRLCARAVPRFGVAVRRHHGHPPSTRPGFGIPGEQPSADGIRAHRGDDRLFAVRQRSIVGPIRLDDEPAQAERLREASGHRGKRRVDVRCREQAGDVVQHDGLAPPILCLSRALPLQSGERACHRRGQQEQQKRDVFGRVRHGEVVHGLDEEPREREEGDDRGNDRCAESEQGRRREHGDEIEHRHVRDTRAPEPDADERGGRRHAAERERRTAEKAPHAHR